MVSAVAKPLFQPEARLKRKPLWRQTRVATRRNAFAEAARKSRWKERNSARAGPRGSGFARWFLTCGGARGWRDCDVWMCRR